MKINRVGLDENDFYRFTYSKRREDLYLSHVRSTTARRISTRQTFQAPPEDEEDDDDDFLFFDKSTSSPHSNWSLRRNLNAKGGDDLFTCIRVPLIIGAFLGLIPITNLTDARFHPNRQRFSWLHPRTLLSILVTSLILLNTILISHNFLILLWKEHNSAGNLVLSFSGVWFFSAGSLVYVFFLLRSRQLTQYFRHWVCLSSRLHDSLIPSTSLTRDVNVICLVVMLDSFGENSLYHFHAHASHTPPSNTSLTQNDLTFANLLEDFFSSNQYLSSLLPYTSPLALLLLLTNKLTTYAWNFGDLFLMVSFRLLSSRFSALNKFLSSLLLQSPRNSSSSSSLPLIARGKVNWNLLRRNFLLLTRLLEEGNDLLTPLIWLSVTTDIFFVCRQLYEGLSPGQEERWLISKVYVAWSLGHLIMRTIGVNLLAAKINEHAHKLSSILQHCHPQEYDDNVRRLERFLGRRVIGITGSGCFVITRSFILMVISAIFTLEVVLLQNASLTVS